MVKSASFEIALSLVTTPRMLLLDEPAAGPVAVERSHGGRDHPFARHRDITPVCCRSIHVPGAGLATVRHLHVRGTLVGGAAAGHSSSTPWARGLSREAASCLRSRDLLPAMGAGGGGAASRSTGAGEIVAFAGPQR